MTLSSPRPLPAGAGYAADPAVRHAATSGGVGSTIIRYLLESGAAAAAVSFTFDPRTLRYRPCLVTSAADYVSVGSIYHEVDLLGFLRWQAAALPGPLVCTCLPCQTKAVRSLLSRHGVGCFLIELTCSSQQSFAATDYLLRRLHVAPRDVALIRYRGNGWPGGIQITLRDGRQKFVGNIGSLWTRIFHSRLFCMPRCFSCPPAFGGPADIVLADPWRIDPPVPSEGRTLFAVRSPQGARLMEELCAKGLVRVDPVPDGSLAYSQEGTLRLKAAYARHRRSVRWLRRVCTHPAYRRAVTAWPLLFSFHVLWKRVFDKIVSR